MRKFLLLAGALMLGASAAMAQAWQVGQHVQIGSIGQGGTVIAVVIPQMTNGGALIKVHLDSMGSAFPDVGTNYDTVAARVTPSVGAATPAAAAPAAAPAAPPPAAPAQPTAPPAGAPTDIP